MEIPKSTVDEIENRLTKLMVQRYKNDKSKINKEVITKISEKISKLQNLLDFNDVIENHKKGYYAAFTDPKSKSLPKWSSVIYDKQSNATWDKIFILCSDILDFIRNNALEKDKLIVYSTGEVDGKKVLQRISFGNESETEIRTSSTGENIKYSMIENEFFKAKKITNETKQEINLQNHYQQFYTIAMEAKQNNKEAYNEGHILEAFHRHNYFAHKFRMESLDDIAKFNYRLHPDNDKYRKDVYINLWYSINADAWFTGGDVANTQVKGDNRKLASVQSVQMVASKIIELFASDNNLSATEMERQFKTLFTQEGWIKMIRKDPEKLANMTLDKIQESLLSKKSSIFDNT